MSRQDTFSGIHTSEDDLLITAARLLRLWQEIFGKEEKPFSPSTDQSVDEKDL